MALTKLTLSSDTDTIRLAKKIASENNMSVSKLFKSLITDISKKTTEKDPLLEKLKSKEIPDDIKNLTGILKGKYPDDYDFKEAKYEYLKERYDL